MRPRIRISSDNAWESVVGYSRAVRSGNLIEVAGTTAFENGKVVAPGDPVEQTRFVLRKIASVLAEINSSLADVIRTRMYVTDIAQWEQIGKVHGEFFREIRPAATMVEVSSLIHPDLVIEIEATAVILEPCQ